MSMTPAELEWADMLALAVEETGIRHDEPVSSINFDEVAANLRVNHIEPLLAAIVGPDTDRKWRLDVENAPKNRVIDGFARFKTALAGFPVYLHFLEGEWRPIGRTLMEPVVLLAWRERTGFPVLVERTGSSVLIGGGQ